MNKFTVTTAIPYVNARPHIGHALEFIQADVIARAHRQQNKEVLLLSGADENALKNVLAAEHAGVPVQEFVDMNARLFAELANVLGVQFDVFQKGSSPEHHASSQELWRLCYKAGDIYTDTYEGLYCVGCEAFYKEEELNENQECFEHPGRALDLVAEENYFFRLSRYQEQLLRLIESGRLRIIPETRRNEVLGFLKQPLRDISISRSNERAKNWGVPVPGDKNQRMYVWFDALNIYQSGIGFGIDEERYKKWWPAEVHVIGKGITKFHAVYWPAFLLSAELQLPKTIFVHGYITVDKQKMSKTLGNVIDPFKLVEQYGIDVVRYFFLREIPPTGDGDFSYDKIKVRTNADLAGGVGNLLSRVLTMSEKADVSLPIGQNIRNKKTHVLSFEVQKNVDSLMDSFQFNSALEEIWRLVSYSDQIIDQKRPWEDPETNKELLSDLLIVLGIIAKKLSPFLPQTSEEMQKQLEGGTRQSLFPRIG